MLLTIKWALPSSQESSKLAFWVYLTPSDVDLQFSLVYHSTQTTIAFFRAWIIRCIMMHWKGCGSRRFLNRHTADHSFFFRGINSEFLKKKKVLKRQNGRLELAGKGVAALSSILPELKFRCINRVKPSNGLELPLLCLTTQGVLPSWNLFSAFFFFFLKRDFTRMDYQLKLESDIITEGCPPPYFKSNENVRVVQCLEFTITKHFNTQKEDIGGRT